jgi:hypothetical protein
LLPLPKINLPALGQRQLIGPSMGYSAAFAKKSHILQFLKGINLGISRAFCCLSSWGSFFHQHKRQQIAPPEAISAASAKNHIFSSTQKAADRPT